jgi:hypothetical protein
MGEEFLELSGVGRVIADGSDEDEAWARRMDSWIVEEEPEDVAAAHVSLFLLFYTFMLGGLLPRRSAHSTRMRAKDFLCCDLRQRLRSVSFVFLLFFVVYIPPRGEKTINEIQSINQSMVSLL